MDEVTEASLVSAARTTGYQHFFGPVVTIDTTNANGHEHYATIRFPYRNSKRRNCGICMALCMDARARRAEKAFMKDLADCVFADAKAGE